MRSNRQGIYELIPSCHSTEFFLFLSYRPVFFICHSGLSLYSVTPASFFICHSGLRAGVQVNIASISAWIPGQARNDKYIKVIPRFLKKTSRDLRINSFLSRHSIFSLLSYRPVFLSVTPASEPESRSTLLPYPPGSRIKPGMTDERSVMAYSTLSRDSAHYKHRAFMIPKHQ